jgi:hypothetical protein|tara:strand:- start:436 stop:672 length:237 start_codon:yes stop_codon:yes gene_type:complete
MNGRQAKKIRRQAKELTVEWLQSLLPEAELEKITTKNFKDYMPEQTHVFANNKIMLSSFSHKWFNKKLKKEFYEKRIS